MRGDPASYQSAYLAFDPVYFEAPCPVCGGHVEESDDIANCVDCDWEIDLEEAL
jgi:hypothetical protein